MEENLVSSLKSYIHHYFPKQKFLPTLSQKNISLQEKTASLENNQLQKTASLENNQLQKTASLENNQLQKTASLENNQLQKTASLENNQLQKTASLENNQLQKTNSTEGKNIFSSSDWVRKVQSANSLDSLRLRIHECQECNLCLNRKNIVYGQGSHQSPLMFIGEAPGSEEDREGIPFIGKAGQLLNKMLLGIAIHRKTVYITNIVKCRPPNNRNPEKIEMKTCFPVLEKQIKLLAPKIIVLLGSVAFQFLFPNQGGIKANHGKVFYLHKKTPVLPTFHPAYLLRKPEELPLAWQDFRKIRQLILSYL